MLLRKLKSFLHNSVEMAKEMVRQDFNRPSVMIWGYMNEIFLRRPLYRRQAVGRLLPFHGKSSPCLGGDYSRGRSFKIYNDGLSQYASILRRCPSHRNSDDSGDGTCIKVGMSRISMSSSVCLIVPIRHTGEKC